MKDRDVHHPNLLSHRKNKPSPVVILRGLPASLPPKNNVDNVIEDKVASSVVDERTVHHCLMFLDSQGHFFDLAALEDVVGEALATPRHRYRTKHLNLPQTKDCKNNLSLIISVLNYYYF